MAEENLTLVYYIENTQPYTVIDITEVSTPFYVEITDLAHDSTLIEVEDLPVPAVACYIENSKVFNITMDSSGRDGKDGLPGKDGVGIPGKDGISFSFEDLTSEQKELLLQPAIDQINNLWASITSLQQLFGNTVINDWFYLDENGNVGTNYNLYSTKEISAYGIGTGETPGETPGTGGATNLNNLIDVVINDLTLTNNQILVYDTTVEGGRWVNKTIESFAPLNHTHLKSEVGLGNVDNTSDLNKPISIATQTALDAKLDTSIFNSHASNNDANVKHLTDAQLSYLNNLISWWKIDASGNLYTEKNLYSTLGVSAYGADEGGTGSSYSRLDAWASYDITKADWVLSALLGKDLDTRVIALEGGSTTTVTTTGAGNAVTAISKSGTTITATKGLTFSEVGHTHTKANITDFPTSMPASDVYAWAKEPTKPTYIWSEIENKPTTLSEYGITDAYTKSQIDGFLALKLDASTFNELFERVIIGGTELSPVYAIKAKYNFYSVGEISAYSDGTTGTGGSATNLDGLTDVVITGTPTNGLILLYSNGFWKNVDPNFSSTVGTVTSVGISVPLGLKVTDSPITSAGTIAIAFDTGYSLPSLTDRTNWTDAYNHSISPHAPSTIDSTLSSTSTNSLENKAIYAALSNKAAINQQMYIGNTAFVINRSAAAQTLSGVSIDGNAVTATNADKLDDFHASDILVTLTKPSSPTLGQEWIDTVTGIKYTWYVDVDGGLWIELGSPAISTSVLFNMLSDISIATRTNNDILVYNGTQWENRSQLTLAVSSATQSKLDLKADITSMNTALNLKANINSPTFTGTVSGITAAMVGLGNVANTAPSGLNVLSASKLTTAINFTIGSTTRSFNGSTAVSWSLTEIGAQSYSSGLTTIAGLSGTGLLKLTSGTWGLDTTSYTRKAIITFTTNASGAFTTNSNIWGLDIILRLKKTTGVVVNNPGVSISTAAINFTSLDPTTDYNCLIIY